MNLEKEEKELSIGFFVNLNNEVMGMDIEITSEDENTCERKTVDFDLDINELKALREKLNGLNLGSDDDTI